MKSSKRPARTRRGDGYAGVGAVRQTGGSLPVYICNTCQREVVWAESKRTGRKYLANVLHGFKGQRYYIAANVHDTASCTGTVESHEADLDRLARRDAVAKLTAEARKFWTPADGADHPGYAEWQRLLDQASAILDGGA